MAKKYLALQDRSDSEPYGVIRHDTETGSIERWNDGAGWFPMPHHADVIVGGEPGAHEISEAECDKLVRSGKLHKMSPADVTHFRGSD